MIEYHPAAGGWVIDSGSVETAAHSLLRALISIRQLAGLPLTSYPEPRDPRSDAEVAQLRILVAARAMGIYLGTRAWEIDLSDGTGPALQLAQADADHQGREKPPDFRPGR